MHLIYSNFYEYPITFVKSLQNTDLCSPSLLSLSVDRASTTHGVQYTELPSAALGEIGQFLEQGIYFSIPASSSTNSGSYSTSSLLQRYEPNMDQLTR
jgi:hypothetical protein